MMRASGLQTISDIRAAIAGGMTAVEVCSQYLDRISATDTSDPLGIESKSTVPRDLLAIARTAADQRTDKQQARLLQSYLDRHAEGAAYRSGDAWMPLLRASGQESLGLR